jgi:hypothetical protein
MSANKRRRIARRLVRTGLALFLLLLMAAAVFWRWPLHVQAHSHRLGQLLREQPPPDEEDAAPAPAPTSVEEYFRPVGRVPLPKTQNYFPDRTFKPSVDGTSFMEKGLAFNLGELGEESYYVRRTDPATHIYRFLWDRSFEPKIVVRLEVAPNGSAKLVSRHHASNNVGRDIVTERLQNLPARDAAKLVKLFEERGFWTAPADDNIYGIDGSDWLFEGCREGRYHVVKIYTPENGNPLKSLGLDLLEKAGFWRGPVY